MKPKKAPILSAVIASVLGATASTGETVANADASIAMQALTGENASVADDLQLVAQSASDVDAGRTGHQSHQSHRSHSSHRSHYSSRF